ncbi:MAG TPA: hypothetical protein VHW65_04360 [Gemmatimonadales bacterium]|nr:hypothetical protein [Gemmatimonadales bacterium]
MNFRPLVILALGLWTGAAGTQARPERWELRLWSGAELEWAELQLSQGGGRILLESADSAFQVLGDLRRTSDSITFVIPMEHRRLAGIVVADTMKGQVFEHDSVVARWVAFRLHGDSAVSPVPQRYVARQVVLGVDSGSERIPGAWMTLLARDSVALDSEYRLLAHEARVPVVSGDMLIGRPRRVALGLDSAWRAAQCALLGRIGSGPAADASFRRIFGTGACRGDLFDVALEQAPGHDADFQLAAALRAVGETEGGPPPQFADSAAMREAIWTLWTALAADSAHKNRPPLPFLHDPSGALALQALLMAFDDAERWWETAVHWLLTHPWLDTPGGARSPAQLVAAFWGVDSLPLPYIRAEPYGDFAAFPVVSAAVLGPRLIRPLNASAAECVRLFGIADALVAWNDIGFGADEQVMPTVLNGKLLYAMSPAAMNRQHGGSALGVADEIRIDPGVTPFIAVASILHEWQHVIIGDRRLAGVASAVTTEGDALRVRADDPWLSEGAAEWASEEALRPAQASAPLLVLFNAEKRRALAVSSPDDPHALGYRLVRAAARATNDRVTANRLVALLSDLPGFARASGLAGVGRAPVRRLDRPTTTTVIPEITFMLGRDDAVPATHRLLLTTPRLEP